MLKEIIENKGRKSAEYYEWNIRYNGGDEKERKVILRMLERGRKREREEANTEAGVSVRSRSVKRPRISKTDGSLQRRTLKRKRE